jgi:tetratricopeptide (TPR) repeat protein
VTTVPEAVEKQVFGEPIIAPIERLRTFLAEDRWNDVLWLLTSLRPVLRRVDPALAVRLTRVLSGSLIRHVEDLPFHDARTLITNFTRVCEPLPVDPNWNRLWAIVWEGPQGDLFEAEEYWRRYVEDLKTAPALSPDERALAQALVWNHLADLNLDDAEDFGDDDDDDDDDGFGDLYDEAEEEEVKSARERVVECLEESLRACPGLLATHEKLLATYQSWKQTDRAAEAARRLLERFPDHVDSLGCLTQHHVEKDEPEQALAYVARLRALKPLEVRLVDVEWAVHAALARHRALQGRWDEGRAEFARAEQVCPALTGQFLHLARRAVFEVKAGQADRASSLIADAMARPVEPAPLWLALQIEGTRYRLARSEIDHWHVRWQAELAKKCRGETAGAMADVLGIYLNAGLEYPHRSTHVKEVLDYLRRATRVKFAPKDLERVCSLLVQLPDEMTLFEKMAQKGVKAYPDSPMFLLVAARLEINKGPYRGRPDVARRQLEKALETAEKSSDPAHLALVPGIKESLAFVSAMSERPSRMPHPFVPDPSMLPPELRRMIDEVCERQGITPEELIDQAFSSMPPGGGPGPRARNRRR